MAIPQPWTLASPSVEIWISKDMRIVKMGILMMEMGVRSYAKQRRVMNVIILRFLVSVQRYVGMALI